MPTLQQRDKIQSRKQTIEYTMDTIAINANEAFGEIGKDKKKFNVSDKAKTAMASGLAGLATGVAVNAVTDAIEGEHGEEQDPLSDEQTSSQTIQSDEPGIESASPENIVTDVNPDEVMLEDPIAEPSNETDMIAEPVTQPEVVDNYHPFANNDHISEGTLQVPQSEDVLIAEDAEIEAVPESDSTVDVICGVDGQEEVTPEDAIYLEDNLYADNGPSNNEYDIQSDLMA